MNSKYKIGQEVGYGRFHFGTPINYGFSRVASINRHGHVKLENGLVFDKYDYERGGSQYSRRFLMHPSQLEDALDRQTKANVRRDTIQNIQRLTSDLAYDGVTDETKQRLIALINSL